MKRVKAQFKDIVNNNIEYFAFKNVSREGKKVGEMFVTDKLTDEQRAALDAFQNVKYVTVSKQYAPEIKHIGIILYDKVEYNTK